ncbi:MAG: iron ABC transporter permease [Bacteroidota bacterium]
MKSAVTFINRLRATYPGWVMASLCIALLLLVPLLAVILVALTGEAPEWEHISNNLLKSYVSNTVLLVAGVAAGASILGTAAAALVVFTSFPGKRFFEWALILPLSIPAYLMSFSYAELCGYEGWISNAFGGRIDLMNLRGAIFIFSLALYPYVYLPLKSFFASQAFQVMEAGASLGRSSRESFFRLVLPLSAPVIGGGVFLCSMEVINDFGVVKYFGVPTFTVGIFRAWTGFADLTSALRLSCLLLLLVFVFMLLRRWQAGTVSTAQKVSRTRHHIESSVLTKVLAFGFCLALLVISFGLPVLQMLSGAKATAGRVVDSAFLTAGLNTLKVAGLTAVVVVIVSVLIDFTTRINPKNLLAALSGQSVMLGYSIPGAVIALGVLAPVTGLDKWIYRTTEDTSWLLSSSLIVLYYALIVRYLAVGINTIRSGYSTLSPNLFDASRSLGAKPVAGLWSVDLPLLRNYLVSSFILVFVDVLKELPLTMILRPFNFDTLAIKAFNLASDELLREASNASLLIVLAGLLPIFVLNRLMKNAGA